MAKSIQATPSVARSLLRVSGPAVLIVAIASISIGAWWFNRDQGAGDGNGASERSRASAESADAHDQGATLLGKARLALKERRLLAPAGDNAIEYYLKVEALESTHAAARQALLELIPPAVAAVESSIAGDELPEAERQFELLQRMGASELSLGPLRAQLSQAKSALERAQTAAAQLESPAAVAIVDGSAAAPAAAPAPSVSPATSTIVARAPQPASDAPATVVASAPSAPTPAAVAASTPPPPAAVVAAPTVQEPRQIVDARPAYPSAAVSRRVEGWVELELAIGADGTVGEVLVVRSQPARIFDREAMRAAQRWRFEPRRENGVAVATRVRKTLSFKLTAG